MKQAIVALAVLSTVLTGCASVKDQKGNVVGGCIGVTCGVRGLFDANHVDSKTGLIEGTIPLFRIGGLSHKDVVGVGQKGVEPDVTDAASGVPSSEAIATKP